MQKVKSKKQFKKLVARMRMKRVQKIMAAVRTHQNITRKQQESANSNIDEKGKQVIGNRIKKLKGRISTTRSRARSRWLRR